MAVAEVELILAWGWAVGGGELVEAAHAHFDDAGVFEQADVVGGGGPGDAALAGEVVGGDQAEAGELPEHGPAVGHAENLRHRCEAFLDVLDGCTASVAVGSGAHGGF